MSYGKVIKKHRRAKNWSQENLANESFTNKSYISQIENERLLPSLYTLKNICNALDLTFEIRVSEKLISP